jgi:hypothetical protein
VLILLRLLGSAGRIGEEEPEELVDYAARTLANTASFTPPARVGIHARTNRKDPIVMPSTILLQAASEQSFEVSDDRTVLVGDACFLSCRDPESFGGCRILNQ